MAISVTREWIGHRSYLALDAIGRCSHHGVEAAGWRRGLLAPCSADEVEAEAAAQKRTIAETGSNETGGGEEPNYPASATLCGKCQTKAVVVMDNCATCLSCGYSKCG